MTTEVGQDVQKAAALLQLGLPVVIPTETVYGLAANAFDAEAVAQIFEIKNRPHFDPLIVHTSSLDRVPDFADSIPSWAEALATAFWPGPLTLVLKKRETIPDLVTSGLPHVAIRVPNAQLTLDMLESLDFPLAAPSANPFGYISPTTPAHVIAQLGGKIAYVVDGGPCSVGVESTIVAEVAGRITILRLGGLPIEAVEEVVGPVQQQTNAGSNPNSPGQLKSHYAPRIPLTIASLTEVHINEERERGNQFAIISFSNPVAGIPADHQCVLSPSGDLHEAARNLFAALRYCDSLSVDRIFAEPVPNIGLGRAINDRLRRAAADH